jgi:DNA-binding CsgD family transcriptional regulator
MKKELRDERELTILKLICRELTSAEIGHKVGISKKRVEGIRLDLMKKTKSRNVVGLVKYAIKRKIYILK